MFDTALKHKPSVKTMIKFLLLLGLLVAYFFFLSWKYDMVTGGIVSALTWSFFVLCTPVADAGFLLDFPLRLITGIKMLVSEIGVWAIAIGLNLWAVHVHPDYYDKTLLTQVFFKILTTPWPYWSIIVLCAFGTFLSIWFGDHVMDAVGNKDKKAGFNKKRLIRLGGTILLFAVVIAAYYDLLSSLGISMEGLE